MRKCVVLLRRTCEALNVLLASFDDDAAEDGELGVDNAAAHALLLAAALAALAVVGRVLVQQELDTLVCENTLTHGKALLVVTTSDSQHVALPLITEVIGGDLSGNALVVEWTAQVLILEVDGLLGCVRWVRDVELHCCCCCCCWRCRASRGERDRSGAGVGVRERERKGEGERDRRREKEIEEERRRDREEVSDEQHVY